MMTNAAPKMRLLLLKSEGQFKHSGKYYLSQGRWHKLHADKPVPKGAAVAAHPHAAGVPTAGKQTYTDEQWESLKLPAENSNASTFNKQIDQLKAAADAGDVTGILGSGYGINTYSKKLAIIANNVLGMLGSTHTVTPGQKPGAHAAVQTAPQIEAGQPAPAEPQAAQAKPDVTLTNEGEKPAADAGPKEGDTKQGADGTLVFKDGRWHKQVSADLPGAGTVTAPAASMGQSQALSMPAFQEGKTVSGVVDYYEAVAQKIMNLAAAGDVAGLEKFKADGLKPNSKGKVSNTWKGKTPNSKILLDMHAKALEHAKGGAVKDAVGHLEQDQKQADIPASEKKEDAELVENIKDAPTNGAAVATAVEHLKGDKDQADLPEAEKKEDAALVQKLEAAQGKPHELDLAEYKTGAMAPTLSSKAFKGDNPAWYSQQNASDIGMSGSMTAFGQGPSEHAKKTLAEFKAAKAAGYEFTQFKTSGLQYANVFVKDGKILTKEGMDALVAGGDAKQSTEPATASAPASDSNVIAPAKGGNLSQKFWISDKGPAKFQSASKTFGVFSADGKKALGKNGQPSAWGALHVVSQIAPHADKMVADGSHEWIDVYGSLEEANAANQNPVKNETPAAATDSAAAAAPEQAPVKKEPRLIIPKKAPEAAPAPATGNDKLAQINWDGQKLPDSNKNAKSHNKQVEKIKQLAAAGDLAGLEALKFGTNTYGKKQELLKQTAIAALKEGGAPAADPAPAPAAAPSLADTFAEMAKKEQYTAIESMAKEKIKADPAGKADVIAALNDAGLKGLAKMVDKETPAPAAAPADDKILAGIAKLKADQKISQDGKDILEAYLKGHPGDLVGAAKEAEAYGYLSTAEAAMGLVAELAGMKSADTGPKEGDTKQGADGMLVLKDGHWVKVEQDQPAQTQAAAPEPAAPAKKLTKEEKEAAIKAAVEAIQIPDFTDGSSKAVYYGQMAEKIKAAVLADGLAGFKKMVTTGSDGSFASKGAALGFKTNKCFESSKEPRRAMFWKFCSDMKAGLESKKGPTKPSKPKAAPTPQAAAPAAPPVAPGALEAMDTWQQTGPQGGSNPGGRFKDENGVEWYCKFPADEDTAKAEVLAAKLYGALGIAGQDAKLVTKDGKVGIASRWQTVSKAINPSALAKVDGVAAGFGADAWLGNWDVVGLAYDNLQIGADGKAMRVDAGGSLMYRAQGGKKAFGNTVTEIDSLRDPKINPQAAKVFGGMTEADITASVAKVLALSDAQINTMVMMYGPGDEAAKKALAATLIARKQDLANKFPKAVKAKPAKPQFNPANLSLPPNFKDWNNSGKGLSSKDFINESNQAAVDAVYAAAKEGDLSAIKNVQAPVFNKETGQVNSHVPLAQHPSQHVKAYWSDMVEEVDLQLNPPRPPEVGEIVLSTDLAEISAMLAPVPSGDPVAAVQKHKKIGNYILLGKVANTAPVVPKQSDTLIGSDVWKQKAKDAYHAASSEAKSTFSTYVTTSGAKALNTALRTGNTKAVVSGKTVSKHVDDFKGLLVDIPEGSSFVRRMGMKGYGQTPNEKAIKELQQFLMTAESGTVIQEPGFSSTSWSGGNKILGNNDIEWEFVAAKGVKMFPGWLTANSGEGEGLLPPNQRYMIVSSKKEGKTVRVKAILLPTIE